MLTSSGDIVILLGRQDSATGAGELGLELPFSTGSIFSVICTLVYSWRAPAASEGCHALWDELGAVRDCWRGRSASSARQGEGSPQTAASSGRHAAGEELGSRLVSELHAINMMCLGYPGCLWSLCQITSQD